MGLKVLGIACSPRSLGNSTWLLKQALQVVQAEGHESEMVELARLNFSFCQGCNACSANGVCVFHDDIIELQEKLVAADRLILAAPIFFMGLNAQAKAMIDRMQPFWAKKYLHHEAIVADPERLPRQGLFLSTAGTHKKDVFQCANRVVRTFFHMLDIQYAGECVYPGVDEAGEIARHPQAMEEVKAATLRLLQIG